MKKVVTFSLWGDDPIYNVGAIENANLLNEIYPGWEGWFYIDKNISSNIKENISAVPNCRVIDSNINGYDGQFTRFKVMKDYNVDVFISRDCDSRLNFKEKAAVDEWLQTKKQFHCMRDNKQWHTFPPVMAGMWGGKRDGLININYLYNFLIKFDNNKYFDDQNGLTNIYNKLSIHFLEHDDNKCFNGINFPKHKPFTYGSFVGQQINERNKPFYREYTGGPAIEK